MPLKQCSDNDKSGWKWGDQGKCYTGPDGKKQAIKQGYAEDPKHFNDIMKSEGYSAWETFLLLTEANKTQNNEL